MNIDLNISIYEGSYTFNGAAVAAVRTEQNGTEYESIINQNIVFAGIGGVQHIGGQNQDIACGGCEFPVAAYKFSFSTMNIIDFKFTVPVHRDVCIIFRETAFIITVWNQCGAVLSFFFGLFVRGHCISFPKIYLQNSIVSLCSSILIVICE